MDLVIKEKKEEPLLSRMEIVAELAFDGAIPSKKEAVSKIASSLKVDENLIVIRKISGGFGIRKVSILAYKYTDEKEKEKIEPKKKEKAKKEGSKEEAPKVEEKPIVPNSSSKAQTKEKPKEEPKKE